jgi:formylglycine-generating enzyme required for sulfatase activity
MHFRFYGFALILILGCTAASAATKAPAKKPPAKPAKPAAAPVKPSDDRPAAFTETIKDTLIKFDMVGIPSGEITVADPAKPGTTIKVKVKAMWISKTEIPWDAYDVFVFRLDEPDGGAPATGQDALSRPSKPYGAADRGYGRKGYPAINLTYLGAQKFCEWLSKKTGRKYRLATEAEWEYACRAGKPVPVEPELEKYAWYWQEKTQPVGTKLPNAWGIYNMLGNVGEWCTGLDGKPVVCGGTFEDSAKNVTPTKRRYQDDSWSMNDPQDPKSKWWLSDAQFVGFRVVCDK